MGYLSKRDLKALATTHRLIRFHANPLLYRAVTIHTEWPRASEIANGLVEAAYILKLINLLVFEARYDSSVARNTEILNTFVPSFSKMTHLCELELKYIRLDTYAQMVILETPLVSLTCIYCQFTNEQLPSALTCHSSVNLLELRLAEDPYFPESPPTFLTRFPNVETLVLTVPYQDYKCFPIFPSLTSFIVCSPIGLDTLHIILRQSPLLARLRCIQRDLKNINGMPPKIPHLQHIEAPTPAVIQLLQSAELESIVILTRSGYGENNRDDINRLFLAIQRGPTQQITSLDMTVWFRDQEQVMELLVNLSKAAPNLHKLTLRVDPFGREELLASPLYNGSARLPKLESLAVSILLTGTSFSQPQVIPDDIVQSFARVFLDTLVQPICPSLQAVKVFPWYDSFERTVLEGEGAIWKFQSRD